MAGVASKYIGLFVSITVKHAEIQLYNDFRNAGPFFGFAGFFGKFDDLPKRPSDKNTVVMRGCLDVQGDKLSSSKYTNMRTKPALNCRIVNEFATLAPITYYLDQMCSAILLFSTKLLKNSSYKMLENN